MSSRGAAVRYSDPLIEATHRLEGQLETLLDTLVEAYGTAIPSYSDPDGELEVDIRAGARDTIVGGLGAMRDEVRAEDLSAPLSDLGRRRAEQGIPLIDVLKAFQIGARHVLDALADVAPRAHRDAVVARATGTVLDVVQTATSIVSAAYVDASVRRAADAEHELQLIVEVLTGLRVADSRHGARLERRGLTAGDVAACWVTVAKTAEPADLERVLRERLPSAVVGVVDDFVVTYGRDDTPLDTDGLPPVGHAVVPGGAPLAFRRARAAWRAASHLQRPLVRYAEVVPIAMALDAPERDRDTFVRHQLGALLDEPKGAALRETLAQYYRCNQSVAATARALHLHRHSLEYRLERIRTLLDVDLKDPETRLMLELALLLAPGVDSLRDGS